MDTLLCNENNRRQRVRAKADWNGLDYLEVQAGAVVVNGQPIQTPQTVLALYFLGKLPAEFKPRIYASAAEREAARKAMLAHIVVEGGRRITGIEVIDLEARPAKEADADDVLLVRVNKAGDFSTYTLRLVGLANLDTRYDHVAFSFKVDCSTDLDCAAARPCPPEALIEPEINYLAKDYASFRQLMLDRLALVLPDWTERHVPDLAIALIEVLAYTGDQLSYYQDAVATEAYLDTARQRISVRRHARLVDYTLHEGCNARAWVCIETDTPLVLPDDAYFITGTNAALPVGATLLSQNDLRGVPSSLYEVFEPMRTAQATPIRLNPEHNTMQFYTWEDGACCLPTGSTQATLIDRCLADGSRALALRVGDVLVLEEVLGPETDHPADANPLHRQAVCLTRVQPGADALTGQPIVEIEWAEADALTFSLCLSAIGPAPACNRLQPISIARGNVVLVDHGQTVEPPERLGRVPVLRTEAHCECAGHASDTRLIPGAFNPSLKKGPLTFGALPVRGSAAGLLAQAVREAGPHIRVFSIPATPNGHEQLFKWSDLHDPTDLIKFWCQKLNAHAQPTQLAQRLHAEFATAKDANELIENLRDALCQVDPEAQPVLAFEADEEQRAPAALARLLSRSTLLLLLKHGEAKPPCEQPTAELVQAVLEDLHALLVAWTAQPDLLSSGAQDAHFVVEVDNEGRAHLRFGDGELGWQPPAGAAFYASYRVGNGVRGNVGAESINHLVLRNTTLSGVQVQVRNPLPAVGGAAAEPLDEAKLFAPHQFRKDVRALQRAITAEDYAQITERNPRLQQAAAELVWTGSWYEATVAIDPRASVSERHLGALTHQVANDLFRYRRAGHDVAVQVARYVPLHIELTVCVKPHYLRGHVRAALLDVFSNRLRANGTLGLFHPDRLTFGEGIYLSQLIAAAQAVEGVEQVQVLRLERQYAGANGELERGVLPLGPLEVAQLANDPSFPERGDLVLTVQGGR